MRKSNRHIMITSILASLSAFFLTGCSNGTDEKGTATEKDPNLTAEAIVAKYLEAIGGVEAHQELKTRRVEGTMIAPGTSEPFPITITQTAPDKKHSRIVHPTRGVVAEGVDGKGAWVKYIGVENYSGDVLKDKLADARFHASTEMVTGGQLSYEKREMIGKHDCHVLKATYPDHSPWSGKTIHFYIDTEEFLLRRISSPAEFGGNKPDVVVTTDPLDYKPIDGIQFPHGATLVFASGGSVKLTIHKVTHGVDVDDSIFASPSHENILNWFEGSWNAEVTRVPDGDASKAEKSQHGLTQTRSSKGTYVVSENSTGRTMSVLSYDRGQNLFRRVVIAPRIAIQQTGAWDPAEQAMTWTGKSDRGLSVVTHTHFTGTDHSEWKTIMKDGDRLVTRITENRTRTREPLPKPEPASLAEPTKAFIQLFEGAWVGESTYIRVGNPDRSSTQRVDIDRTWSSGGRFMVERSADDGAMWVLTGSPELERYRSVLIMRNTTSSMNHHWDDAKQVMTTKGYNNSGNNSGNEVSGSYRVIDRDHHEYKRSLTNGDNLVLEIHRKLTRRKP